MKESLIEEIMQKYGLKEEQEPLVAVYLCASHAGEYVADMMLRHSTKWSFYKQFSDEELQKEYEKHMAELLNYLRLTDIDSGKRMAKTGFLVSFFFTIGSYVCLKQDDFETFESIMNGLKKLPRQIWE